MSRLFNRLPGHPRTPAGRERQILRMLPKALLIGTALLALPFGIAATGALLYATDHVVYRFYRRQRVPSVMLMIVS